VARTILCIDDDQSTFETLGEALGAGEYSILHAGDPEEGFRLVREEEPDLVLLEILLPRGNGLDLAERIRVEGGDASEVPIVVVTSGERTPQLYGRAIELGVLEFITKPVLDSQILEAVREFASKPKAEVEAQPGEAAGGAAEPFSRAGDLGELAFPELLHRLHAAGASGALIVEEGGNRLGLQLRNGSPVAVSAGRPRESLEDFLLRSGTIAAEQHDRLCEQLALGMGSPREVLAGMDLLSEDECEKAIRAQAEERLFELFHWCEGTYRFQAGKRLSAASAFELGSGAGSIILRGILEHVPMERVREALESKAALYVEEGMSRVYRLDDLELSAEQRQLLSDAQGDRTLSALLGPDEQRLRLLYAFVVMGLLELNADPVLVLVDEVSDQAADAGEEEDGEATSHPAAEPDPPGEAKHPTAKDTGLEEWAAELEATLANLAERFSGSNDFSVLGVGEDPSDAEVRDAYQEWLERIPWDAIPKSAARLKQLAENVRSRIDGAYQNLADASSRERYTRDHREQEERRGAEEIAARALEAEQWFRKGERLLGGKKYEESLEAFGMAAHLDPEEGEYLSHLGWALYLSNPSDTLIRREALEHIAKGIKLSPDRELSYLYLGRIFKATDDARMARKMFTRALKIQPDCHPALQELRLLEIRAEKSKKGKGVLHRLRGG
jgi:CheY-like chemotaxis protein/tetratricopeptide (TPR) repeat protein